MLISYSEKNRSPKALNLVQNGDSSILSLLDGTFCHHSNHKNLNKCQNFTLELFF